MKVSNQIINTSITKSIGGMKIAINSVYVYFSFTLISMKRQSKSRIHYSGLK